MAFNSPSGVKIRGGAHNVVHGDQNSASTTIYNFSSAGDTSILQSLAARAAESAGYNAEQRSPPPRCHPNTRVTVLDRLSRWIEGNSKTTLVYWLHGSAGVGKSAIAQKLSEDYATTRLAAAFFFSRNDGTRDRLDRFVATIAYQFCTSNSFRDVVGPLIIEAIRADPNIFHTTFENQFRKLLLEPFAKLKPAQRQQLPNLIVIDGLDECAVPGSQERLLRFISDTISFSTEPFPFILLVCSRPEPHIRDGFHLASFTSRLECLPISDTTIRFLGHKSESDCDIERFLSHEFALLRKKHRAALREEDESWPGPDAMRALVWRASGQFIFAVTVIKYIDTRDDLPQDRLKTILMIQSEDIPDSPYPELDLLYRQILSTCSNWDKTRLVLRILVTKSLPNTGLYPIPPRSTFIKGILKLRAGEVETLLSRLHSVLRIPDDESSNIHILHASFTEFLLDRFRSGEFWTPRMPRTEYCDLIAVFLLDTLSCLATSYPPYCFSFATAYESWQKRLGEEDDLTVFSVRYWSDYCVKVLSPSADLLAGLNKFDPYPVAAMLLCRSPENMSSWTSRWAQAMVWAQSLEGAPQAFISRLEYFFSGFRIGLAPTSPVQTSSYLESFLFRPDDGTDGPIQEWPHVPFGRLGSHRNFLPLVLPTTTDASAILPEHWVVANVPTKRNDLFFRINPARNIEILRKHWVVMSCIAKSNQPECDSPEAARRRLEPLDIEDLNAKKMNNSDDTIPQKSAIEARAPDTSPSGCNKAIRGQIAHDYIDDTDAEPQTATQGSAKSTPQADVVSSSTRCQKTKVQGSLYTSEILQPQPSRYPRFGADIRNAFESDVELVDTPVPPCSQEENIRIQNNRIADGFPQFPEMIITNTRKVTQVATEFVPDEVQDTLYTVAARAPAQHDDITNALPSGMLWAGVLVLLCFTNWMLAALGV